MVGFPKTKVEMIVFFSHFKRSCQQTDVFIYLDDCGVMGNLSNSPSTT